MQKLKTLLRKNILLATFFLVVFCNLIVCRCSLAQDKPPLTNQLFKKGEALYQKQCAVCHGPQGDADGKAAYLLYPKPRDFIKDKFRLVSTTSMEATDEDLFKAITRGMPGSAMPPWESLSPQDRWALVYYVRYLSEKERFKTSGEITEDMIKNGIPWELIEKMVNKKISEENIIKIPQEPQVTPESLNKGNELFLASCAGCHGKTGKGDGQEKMIDTLDYPVKARDLTTGIFKGASSSPELYCRMVGGMPGSPMPNYLGAMTEEQIWDLVHYVQTLPESGAAEQAHLLHEQKINAQRTDVEISLDPFADQWSKANPVFVSLMPLWWRDDRVEGVEVKVLYSKDKIGFYLSWQDVSDDSDSVAVQSFPDGAAIQFSSDKNPPFFGMGEKDNPVSIWHWKASWQGDEKERTDIESRYPHAAVDWYKAQKDYQPGAPFEIKDSKTRFHDPEFITGWGAGNPLSDPQQHGASEAATSEGLGSYTTQKSLKNEIQTQGINRDGKWHVVFVRQRSSADKKDVQFKAGEVSVAFAIWDGSGGDRNGQKMVSIWNKLILK